MNDTLWRLVGCFSYMGSLAMLGLSRICRDQAGEMAWQQRLFAAQFLMDNGDPFKRRR